MSSPTHSFAVDQWVRVMVSSEGKTEIGQIRALDGENVTVTTISGFDLKVKKTQLKKAFLLVLDLNGVLVHRTKNKSVQQRPHVKEFLQFVIKNFIVGVWSSCIQANGVAIVDKVFGSMKRKLHFQWYRDRCTPNPTAENKFGTKKDLMQIWAEYPSSFNEGNTVIIDDSPEKCSHPQSAFCPETFAGHSKATTGSSNSASLAAKKKTPPAENSTPTASTSGGGGETTEDDSLLQVVQVLKQVLDADSLEPVRLAMLHSPPPTHCIEEDEDDADDAPLVFSSPKQPR